MTKTVLLVEDEQNIIEAVSFILSRSGWTVVCHSNGATANEKIVHARPDVLILDTMLPEKSGLEILSDLRKETAFENLPVLMLTARGQAKDKEVALNLGATEYMTKPFSNAELVEKIDELHLASTS